VAINFQNADGEPPLERDLLIHCRANTNNPQQKRTERISVLDPNLEPMVYPLFFPYGDQSWGINIPLQQIPQSLRRYNTAINTRTRVTQIQYYSYRLSICDLFNPFFASGKLTQQYLVDIYVKMEANRLNYVSQNQSQLRVKNILEEWTI